MWSSLVQGRSGGGRAAGRAQRQHNYSKLSSTTKIPVTVACPPLEARAGARLARRDRPHSALSPSLHSALGSLCQLGTKLELSLRRGFPRVGQSVATAGVASPAWQTGRQAGVAAPGGRTLLVFLLARSPTPPSSHALPHFPDTPCRVLTPLSNSCCRQKRQTGDFIVLATRVCHLNMSCRIPAMNPRIPGTKGPAGNFKGPIRE